MTATRTESFLVSHIGTCLFLKLCGFVEESRAEIRDVSENLLRVHLGDSWLKRVLGLSRQPDPLDIEIFFVPTDSLGSVRPQASIQVVVRDASWVSSPDRFDAAARRILRQLRGHLMAH